MSTPADPTPDPITSLIENLWDEPLQALAERLAPLLAPLLAPHLAKMQIAAHTAPPSKYLTVAEAADLMRAPRQRVYDLFYDGRLTKYGTDGARLVLREEVEAHLRGEDTGPTGEAVRRARGAA